MCGIAGCADLERKGRALPWARALMRHRGPDSEGCVSLDGPEIVLEHTRLAIIDPENRDSDQPMSDPSGRWTITYNGEVFNHRELRRELEARGVRFRTRSDTEVLLHLFIRDGVAAFGRLRGMFAFLIADRKTGEIVAARDQVGVKPLYWAVIDGLFVAASELRTMLGNQHLSSRLDAAGVVEYLAFGHTAGERTLVEDVRKLPPGHALRIRDGAVDVFEYWDPLAAGAPAPEEPLADDLRTRLSEAVAAAMVSDVPVSMMLSGGLDSSLIAALAARHSDPRDLTAYSVSFGLPDDEAAAARRLAHDLGIRHREIELTQTAVADGFDDWLRSIDVPSANPTWIAVWHISRAVHDDGGKVLLSGDGGDELLGGYSRWMTYLRFHDRVWRRAPMRLRRMGGLCARPFAGGLAGDIARRARDGGELFVGSRPFHDDDLLSCLGPRGQDALRASPPEKPVRELRRSFDGRAQNPSDYLAWMSYVSFNGHLVEDYLARLDKMGMVHSVEGRVPLLDPNLVSWSFGVPQSKKTPNFRQKALMRAAVAPLLPDYILKRPKQGFCPPVADWAGSLLASRAPKASRLVDEGLVRPDAFARLARPGTVKASFASWTLGTLAAWCEANL
ncbi:MAG: asparagine synthase (glutamine-hydrolyzing) [Chloroflexota bacterium]|nr:asparagine synthase (glutamine-hydrolyzing) [Chloroflexota bacterium]